MIALIQRVSAANVKVERKTIASIERGALAFIAAEKTDSCNVAKKIIRQIISYRIFPDEGDRMAYSLKDINGSLLLVPQFTLAANTQKGLRPSFSDAAPNDLAETIYNTTLRVARMLHPKVKSGRFGANMSVSLVNEGPATFILKS